MKNEFVQEITSNNIKGCKAVYMDKVTGEIKITAEYSPLVLKMVMQEINETNKYQFKEIINA